MRFRPLVVVVLCGCVYIVFQVLLYWSLTRPKLTRFDRIVRIPRALSTTFPTIRFLVPIGDKYRQSENTFSNVETTFGDYDQTVKYFPVSRFGEEHRSNSRLNTLHIKDGDENSRFLEMMRKWISIDCDNSEIFMFLTDTTTFCPNTFPHFASLYQWAEQHVDEWTSIQMGFGYNSVLMQCRDIPQMIEAIEASNEHYEESISMMIDSDRPKYTYRYNLFKDRRAPDGFCHAWNLYPSIYPSRNFDLACDGKMMSPCKNPIVQELSYRTYSAMDIPLEPDDRNTLIKRMGLRIVAGYNMFRSTCSQICQDSGLECKENSAVWINNCELIRRYVNLPCRCVNMIYNDTAIAPFMDLLSGHCKLLEDTSIFTCDASREATARLCVCKKSKRGDMGQVTNTNPMVQRFHEMMKSYHQQRREKLGKEV
jgi:hypothetical protein